MIPELQNQFSRVFDLFCRPEPRPNWHRHVIVGDHAHVPEIQQLSKSDWDDLDGLLVNLWEKTKTEKRIILLRALEVSVDDLIADAVKQVADWEMPRRIKRGKPLAEKERKLVDRRLEEIRNLFNQDSPDLEHRNGLGAEGVEDLVKTAEQEAEKKADELFNEWKELVGLVVSVAGVEPLQGEFTNLIDDLKERREDVKTEIAEAKEELTQAAQEEFAPDSQGGWLAPWSSNGRDELPSAERRYRKAHFRATVLDKACEYLRNLLDQRLTSVSRPSVSYMLPEGTLLDDLTERLSAHGVENLKEARADLRSYIEEECLVEVVRAMLAPELEERMEFDFAVSQEAYTGVLIVSPFSEKLSPLATSLNPDRKQIKQRNRASVKIFRVAVIKRLEHVPALAHAFRGVVQDGDVQVDMQRKAVDIHPMRLRDRDGVLDERGEPDLDYAALVLLMAYLAPGLLVLDDTGRVELSREEGTPVRYSSLAALAHNLTVKGEYRIRVQFWNEWFAPNRQHAVRRIGRLKGGDPYARDKRHDRFERLEQFVGAKRLQSVLRELLHQVRTAIQCWQ
jgi:hypothetical protein